MKIPVTAKITAGTHPRYGAIIQGQTYTINEADFSPVLFERDPIINAGAEKRPPTPVTPAKPGKKGR